ncbi:protein-tyrosine phosphatase-like protein, partial [Syncephalastrum racemosum]
MISVVRSPVTQQKFVILDAPTKKTLPHYIATLEKENVSDLVRICNRPSAEDPFGGRDSYDADLLEHETGIRVIDDIKFQDGGVPSPGTIQRWLELTEKARESGTTVAVHCVAGIGRAPVLVTLSFVEAGMDPLDAISYIRQHRRGALNKQQIRFLDSYRR